MGKTPIPLSGALAALCLRPEIVGARRERSHRALADFRSRRERLYKYAVAWQSQLQCNAVMTGCDQRCATDSDEGGQDNLANNSTEDVPVSYQRDGVTQDGGYRSLVEDKVLSQREGHPFRPKYKRPSGTVESHFTVGVESAEASLPQQLQSYVVSVQKAPAATSTLPGTSEVTGGTSQLARQEQDEDVDPGTTTDTERQTDTDPNQPRHESPEEYQAYIKEVRRAGRQNFAKQTADLVRRTLQVGNWEDIVRQIPLANQFLSETIETVKSEAMTIYDKHVQDKGSPQRLYKLQEALVKRAVLSLSKRCKGMSNCT
ncbi:hypothetical protein Bbelb_324540 [Branchiostoma belcheri]|nr:hypothetical protein Bbelb_324540 [Branchiostoma belcheri]